jgi:hypothetical protein
MGAQGSGNASKSESFSQAFSASAMSGLANTQNKVLKQREKLFQDYFMPEFQEVYEAYDPDSEAGKAEMGLLANQINNTFDSVQKQTTQKLAQQDLLGSGAGTALTAQNDRAKASALAAAYAQQIAKSNTAKSSMLANLAALMPQTTTAAPVISQSMSQSTSESLSGGGGGGIKI